MSKRLPLLSIRMYVSEGRNPSTLSALTAVASEGQGPASHRFVDHFIDYDYNRTSFTFISRDLQPLVEIARNMLKEACVRIDMSQHTASHPCIGLVDHISCHDFSLVAAEESTIGSVTESSIALARRLATIVAPLGPSCYLYGAAAKEGTTLAALRRSLGYFELSGYEGKGTRRNDIVPDVFGSDEIRQGFCCIGAVPWVINYNVQLEQVRLATA